MFTGIITNLGKLSNKNKSRYTFYAPKSFIRRIKREVSVAVNGVCLTVINKNKESFSTDVIPETVKRTILGRLQIDSLVNLELPATANDFLSGHILQGHIDGTGTIEKIHQEGNSQILKIKIPPHLNKYIVEKGFVAVNGISLTVIEVKHSYFTVGIIPYTWKHTMLHEASVGNQVNIEVDILAKYLEKLVKENN